MARREDARLVAGRGRYTTDRSLPGQLHAAFVRSNRAHADLLGVDAAEARALPGVVAVYDGADARRWGMKPLPTAVTYPGRDGQRIRTPFRPPLAEGRVRHVGECIALVVADSAQRAHEAAERVVVDYRERPVVATIARALEDGAPLVHDEIAGNVCFEYDSGDAQPVDAAFARAAHVARVSLVSQRLVAAPLEPRACLAAWDAATGTCEVHVGTQGVSMYRDALATATGVPPERLRIVTGDVGGSFGIRGAPYPEDCALVMAARWLGKPIKWVATRSESFVSDAHGRALEVDGELALDAQGRFLAIRLDWRGDLGAYHTVHGPMIDTLNTSFTMTGCYRIAAACSSTRLVMTNTVPIGPYRGAGRPDVAYAVERLVDEAARLLDVDRIELRLRNAVPPDAFPWRTPNGTVYDSGDYAAMLDRAARAAGWSGFEARRAEAAARGRLRGIGCALFVEPSGGGSPVGDRARIAFEPDGRVALHTPAQSTGQGHETALPAIVAAELGIDAQRCVLRAGADSAQVAGAGSFGSRSTMLHGSALALAARAALERARRAAAERWGMRAEDVVFEQGGLVGSGGEGRREIRLEGLVDALQCERGLDGAHPLDAKATMPAARAFPSGAHVAEVEIDPATGETRIVAYTAVDDCGSVLDAALVDGQLHGGLAQGAGQVLGEHAIYDEDGQLLTGSFMDYAMPRAGWLPRLTALHHPVPSPTNPLGAKGAGEAGTTGALPTLANAILDALAPVGVKALQLPASPHRVWRAIVQARADE